MTDTILMAAIRKYTKLQSKRKRNWACEFNKRKWVLYYMFYLLPKDRLCHSRKPGNQYTLVLLLAPGFILSLLALKKICISFIFYVKSCTPSSWSQTHTKKSKWQTPHGYEYAAIILNALWRIDGWMDGVLPSSTPSSFTPLKPGCRLLIQCSYINMLSSRGQRWAHTELSCCQAE